MKKHRPDLFEKAMRMNKDDGYKMYDYYMMRKQPWPFSPAASQTESSEDLTDYEFDYEEEEKE